MYGISKVRRIKAGVKEIDNNSYIETYVKGVGIVKRQIPELPKYTIYKGFPCEM